MSPSSAGGAHPGADHFRMSPLPLLIAAVLAVVGVGEWAWPVDPPRAVLRAFVLPPEPWRPGHRGIDIAAPQGLVLAPADGTVSFVGWVVDRGVLAIDHGDGVVSSFEPVEAAVEAGASVAAGQPVARVAGVHCARTCVHVGLRVDGEYRNPLLLLGGLEWPVLLPTRG